MRMTYIFIKLIFKHIKILKNIMLKIIKNKNSNLLSIFISFNNFLFSSLFNFFFEIYFKALFNSLFALNIFNVNINNFFSKIEKNITSSFMCDNKNFTKPTLSKKFSFGILIKYLIRFSLYKNIRS